MKKSIKIILIINLLLLSNYCKTKQSVKFLSAPIPKRTNIAVIIDCPNNIKNVVLAKFLKKGYKVKAINAADFYSLNNIFDIKDFKYIAYEQPETGFFGIGGEEQSALVSTQKTYENIYKLHVYNFEAHKAKILEEIKNKWKINYLIILELKDWQTTSWARAIELSNYNLIWIENYPTKYTDNLDDVISHFVTSISGSK